MPAEPDEEMLELVLRTTMNEAWSTTHHNFLPKLVELARRGPETMNREEGGVVEPSALCLINTSDYEQLALRAKEEGVDIRVYDVALNADGTADPEGKTLFQIRKSDNYKLSAIAEQTLDASGKPLAYEMLPDGTAAAHCASKDFETIKSESEKAGVPLQLLYEQSRENGYVFYTFNEQDIGEHKKVVDRLVKEKLIEEPPVIDQGEPDRDAMETAAQAMRDQGLEFSYTEDESGCAVFSIKAAPGNDIVESLEAAMQQVELNVKPIEMQTYPEVFDYLKRAADEAGVESLRVISSPDDFQARDVDETAGELRQGAFEGLGDDDDRYVAFEFSSVDYDNMMGAFNLLGEDEDIPVEVRTEVSGIRNRARASYQAQQRKRPIRAVISDARAAEQIRQNTREAQDRNRSIERAR